MIRKIVIGEQIDIGLMYIFFVKELVGEFNKFSCWEESLGYKLELKFVQSMKVICVLDFLVQLFVQKCCVVLCQLFCIVDFILCGISVLIKWKCVDGYSGKFCLFYRGDDDFLLVNNLQVLVVILFLGNNFEKIVKFVGFFGLFFIFKIIYYCVQRIYVIFVVIEWWRWQ